MPDQSFSLNLKPIIQPNSILSRGCWLIAALASFSILVGWLIDHPLGITGPAIALSFYAFALILYPAVWLILLPMLWPVADLTVWSGRIYFTETDALVLTTLFAIGLRVAFSSRLLRYSHSALRLSLTSIILFFLLLSSYTLSTLPIFTSENSLDSLASSAAIHLNGLRLSKALLSAILLLPSVHLSASLLGPRRIHIWLAIGLIAGLSSAALAASWERFAFTDLLNFSTDYRTTALFWEMNMGGAALDGWLALTFPAMLFLLFREHQPIRTFALSLLCILSTYAIFTTFSRGLYAAIVISVLILIPSFFNSQKVEEKHKRSLTNFTITLLLFGAIIIGGILAFSKGGYRAAAAWMGFIFLLFGTGDTLRYASTGTMIVSIAIAGMTTFITTLLFFLDIPKWPYISYFILWFSALIFLIRLRNQHTIANIPTQVLSIALMLSTGANLILVGVYWGGNDAFLGTVIAFLIGILITLGQRYFPKPLWPTSTAALIKQIVLTGAAILVAIGGTGYYVGERFSTVDKDFTGRIEHWTNGLNLLQTTKDYLIGIGTGRYADAYFWHTPNAAFPGTIERREENGESFLRMGGSQYARGFGELLRFSQRIASDLTPPFQINIRARSPEGSQIYAEICDRNLLYPQNCLINRAPVKSSSAWQTINFDLGKNHAPISSNMRFLRPRVFSISNDSRHVLDITDVWITDAEQKPVIQNGSFSHNTDYWLLSSDRHHLPWHAKNFLLHIFIEQGLFGLIPFITLFGYAAIRLLRQYNNGIAPVLLASLTGFFVVGLFDSLLDVPRLGTFLFLLLWISMSLRPVNSAAPVAP